MLRWVQQCILRSWKLVPLLRTPQQASIKLKVLRLFVATVAFGALITTSLFTAFHIKFFRYAHPLSSVAFTPDTLSSDDQFRFNRTPYNYNGLRFLSTQAATLDSNSGRLERMPSLDSNTRSIPTKAQTLAQPTPYRDCKSWKNSPHHKTTLTTSIVCARHYTLLILVASAPENLARRNLIRLTWGRDNGDVPQWNTYFLIAQTRNQIQSDLVKEEHELFGDIIRADYYEHYWNQSLKIQMAFEWAVRYCNFSFLLKADDDVLVNGRSLIDFLHLESTPKEGLYLGKLHHHPFVQRDGKWSVSYEEYNQTHYPDFCSGAGFVMTYDVIECAVSLFDVMKPYRLDDVYVGMLANKLGVVARDHSGFVMPWAGYDECNFVPNTLAQHRATGACLMKLFRMHNFDKGG